MDPALGIRMAAQCTRRAHRKPRMPRRVVDIIAVRSAMHRRVS